MVVACIGLVLQSLAWQPVPLLSAESRKAGIIGGEGGQWPRGIAVAGDGTTVFLAIDVAGIYRSLDGGITWQLSTVGLKSRGCAALAVDPRNPDRVVAVGANSSPVAQNGLYLSTDRGASWRQTLPASLSGLDEQRDQVVFDPETYSADLKGSRNVYWSRIAKDHASWGEPEQRPALYRSVDGGANWSEIADSKRWAGSILRMRPGRKGHLLAGNSEGLHLSTNDGSSFTTVATKNITGLDVSGQAPEQIWISTAGSIERSPDGGKTWVSLSVVGLARPGYTIRNVRVSPVDARRLLVWTQEDKGWSWQRWASHDGGATWTEARKDAKHAFLPDNSRQGLFAWHPKDRDVAFSVGGNWPTRSTDGGRTWRWSGQGVNAVYVGGRFNFSLSDPKVMFFGSQDYNGAATIDGGGTWTYTNISGNGWGGFCYGGYAVTRDFLVVGHASGWGAPRVLRVSTNGGRDWRDTGIQLGGFESSLGWPGDPKVAFAHNHRSLDGGATWSRMVGCDGVLTVSRGLAYGVRGEAVGSSVVVSADRGATWKVVATSEKRISDLAIDAVSNRVYVAAEEHAYVFGEGKWSELKIPADHSGGTWVKSVAVDPADPRVVYVGSCANIYSTDVAVLRSVDSGKTWANLTVNKPLADGQRDGGREAATLRVNPATRELWVATSCYGIWKISGPGTRPN